MIPDEIAFSADLGGSSKYSSKILEDRSRERFMRTAIDHELVDPKEKINLEKKTLVKAIKKNVLLIRKGESLILLYCELDIFVVTQLKSKTLGVSPGRVIFSC